MQHHVAPLAGARIEISMYFMYISGIVSPLSQGRELKLTPTLLVDNLPWSPLSQGRELKYARLNVFSVFANVSPLSQGRELKYKNLGNAELQGVSPLSQGRELK